MYYVVMQGSDMVDKAQTRNRRLRLKELVDSQFGGEQKALLEHMRLRGHTHSQPELSSLMKIDGPKSFGEEKARALAEKIGLGALWFDCPLGSYLERYNWQAPASPDVLLSGNSQKVLDMQKSPPAASAQTRWPFSSIAPSRFYALSVEQRRLIERNALDLVVAFESSTPASKRQQKAAR